MEVILGNVFVYKNPYTIRVYPGCAETAFDLVFLSSDTRHGQWFNIVANKQSVEIRITRGGELRVGKPKRNQNEQATS
jgi:hypothetical protein